MADTSVMEYTAEDLIAHKLLRAGILVAKPKFDQNGADLIALMEVSDGAKFCRIQCKGRSLVGSKSSAVELAERYVSDGLVVFLFVETGETEKSHLYCFFAQDIRNSWRQKDEKFILSLARSRFESELAVYGFNEEKVGRIKGVINAVNAKQEFRRMLDVNLSVVEQNDTLVATATIGPSVSFNAVEEGDTVSATVTSGPRAIGT